MNYGIICEFNPFHKGHKHLFDTIKSENDSVTCIMSGNLVQRGEFAIYDKFTRAKEALQNGADLVIELPCVYSVMSAQGFAENAVNIIESTGCIDAIAFGGECDDIYKLINVAKKVKDSEALIKEEMKKGLSYPAARKEVVDSDILDTPNNILAIEYINATKLKCCVIKRIGSGHDSDDINYSASAIRASLPTDYVCSLKNCEKAVLAKLRTMTAEDFINIEDVSEGLENRLCEAVSKAASLDELYDYAKTKRYTHSRIRRIVLRAYLGITKDYSFKPPYIRILGFNDKGRSILAEMKKSAALPVISRYSDVKELDENAKRLFELECRCTDLYALGYKKALPCGAEQKSQIVII